MHLKTSGFRNVHPLRRSYSKGGGPCSPDFPQKLWRHQGHCHMDAFFEQLDGSRPS